MANDADRERSVCIERRRGGRGVEGGPAILFIVGEGVEIRNKTSPRDVVLTGIRRRILPRLCRVRQIARLLHFSGWVRYPRCFAANQIAAPVLRRFNGKTFTLAVGRYPIWNPS